VSGAAATREAFGDAIVRVGGDERIVVLDGDLRNSNFSERFEAAYPGRFVEVGIAEHNMLGIALASRGMRREAVREFERALTLKPDFADARQNLERAR